ncbi:protein of unknown function [Shewanella benthica]|uniref:Uncharacterized protein n=1 Tax=Shewanella benthica TaxID=43661 RepID=A0A330M3W3_9GAMM|nr:protein of unknown function [Shewanella benthica]
MDKMRDNLQNLIALEQKLRIAVPELEKYPLIDSALELQRKSLVYL